MYQQYLKKLPRLEYILPIVYLIIATVIIIYQKIVPDYTQGYDVMTGAINIRTSDMILIILSFPTIPFWNLFNLISANIISKETIDKLMFMISTGYGRNISLTYSFFLTPFFYFLLGWIIRKYVDYTTKSKEKARR